MPDDAPDLNPFLNHSDDDILILGDINAHHVGWHSPANDARGDRIASDIENSTLCVLNSDSPTRLPRQGSPSSPNITIISAHLALSALWTTHTQLRSDHLPIVISFPDCQPSNSRTSRSFSNLRLADWDGFRKETEALFSTLSPPTSLLATLLDFKH